MINEIYVFDDIIDKNEQNFLFNLLSNSDLKWVYGKNITGNYGKNGHNFLPGKVLSELENETIFNIIKKIEGNVVKKLNLNHVKTYRWKFNWTEPIGYDYDPMKLLHIDNKHEHIVIVYYVNDTTGDTCIFDNIDGNNSEVYYAHLNKEIDYDRFKLIKRIEPKMGRAVVFNGLLHHYGEYPIEGNRFTLNLNFVANNKIKSLI